MTTGGDVAALDPNDDILFAAQAELGRSKEPVDDVVRGPDAVVDQLAIARGANDEEWRKLALGNPGRELDVDLATIVECAKGLSGRVVAADHIAKLQLFEGEAGIHRCRFEGLGSLPSEGQKSILWVVPGYRCHPRLLGGG